MIPVKNFDELMLEARRRLEGTEITAFSPGTSARMLLEILNDQISTYYEVLDNNLVQSFITTATGASLDFIGSLLGLPRNIGSVSMLLGPASFRFYTKESSAPFTLPAGIRVLDDAGREYTTMGSATFSDYGGGMEAFVEVMATEIGSVGNAPRGAIRHHLISQEMLEAAGVNFTPEDIYCENVAPADTGYDAESDENYRYRLMNQVVGQEKANETSIRLAALSVGGVRNVEVRPWTYGTGSFSVFVDSDYPIVSDGILGAVQEAIELNKALGMKGVAERPIYKGVMMSINIVFSSDTDVYMRDTIADNVRSSIITYINSLPMGGTIVISNIIQTAKNVSENVYDVNISALKIGDFDHINDRYLNMRSVFIANQTIRWNEKYYTSARGIAICNA